MKKNNILMALIVGIVLTGCVAGAPVKYKEFPDDIGSISVAAWNLQVFGKTKADKADVMAFYDEKMSQYDIIFVQEIRDASGTAFEELCAMLEEYNCQVSSRDGRSSSKEQIGIIYQPWVTVFAYDRIPDPDDVWERAPVRAELMVDDYYFTVFSAHLKPSDVKEELIYLDRAARSEEGNVVVMGDLNADCDYYNDDDILLMTFGDWNWAIDNLQDTTVSATNCAYDRIIINDNMFEEVKDAGVDKVGIEKQHSDHYLVWMEVVV